MYDKTIWFVFGKWKRLSLQGTFLGPVGTKKVPIAKVHGFQGSAGMIRSSTHTQKWLACKAKKGSFSVYDKEKVPKFLSPVPKKGHKFQKRAKSSKVVPTFGG